VVIRTSGREGSRWYRFVRRKSSTTTSRGTPAMREDHRRDEAGAVLDFCRTIP
jgi:hypothetical protein